MFVAIRGDRFDANTFAREALEKGAAYVIIDNPDFYIDDRTIVVSDGLQTLQQLAKFHRKKLGLPIVALTGSNGKTTTKELICAVLSQKYHTQATVGNLNNHIGVPLTLLSFDEDTEIGIVEMGANHQKEIEFLCELAQPDYGYITNFGKAHLEGFGGIEGVIKGKSEMYDFLSMNQRKVFVNADDSMQLQLTESLERVTFGVGRNDVDTVIDQVTANPFVEIDYEGIHIKSNLIGIYNANNICAAIVMGRYFGVNHESIKSAIEGYVPDSNRSQLLHKNSNEIILDAYNANPSSMSVAIANFVQLDKRAKVMVLGDMFELGLESKTEHEGIVNMLVNQKDVDCHFIGKDFNQCKKEIPHLHFYESFELFEAYLKTHPLSNKTILIKGSRGMALERTLEFL